MDGALWIGQGSGPVGGKAAQRTSWSVFAEGNSSGCLGQRHFDKSPHPGQEVAGIFRRQQLRLADLIRAARFDLDFEPAAAAIEQPEPPGFEIDRAGNGGTDFPFQFVEVSSFKLVPRSLTMTLFYENRAMVSKTIGNTI